VEKMTALKTHLRRKNDCDALGNAMKTAEKRRKQEHWGIRIKIIDFYQKNY
jgi:hypothetical protein